MTIEARIVCDSINKYGNRLTTFVLKYPRFIHSEFMTHRQFSRNASSSRAIPVNKMIEAITKDPAMPVFWGKNQSGMQAKEELDQVGIDACKVRWLHARDEAIDYAECLIGYGLHKQIANRILEPWMHIEVVCTATEWDNWYALRNHADAQPEIKALAEKMLEAHNNSKPELLTEGQFHLPFITYDDYEQIHNEGPSHPGWADARWLAKISAARCARVSYLKHDGTKATFEEDMVLYDRLMGGTPKHASPTEHQAMVPDYGGQYPLSNLKGWHQFRKMISGENITNYDDLKKIVL